MIWFPYSITSYYLSPGVFRMHLRLLFYTSFILTPILEALIMISTAIGD